MKKVFLIVVLLSTLIPIDSLFANDIIGSIDNGRISWHWYKSDSSLYVMGEGLLMNQEYGIKVFVDGDSIPIGFFNGFRSFASDVKKVYVGEGITYIGIYTFRDFCNLEEVYLPSTLKLIDYAAFNGCNFHLKKFYMPQNLKKLGVTSLGTNGPFCSAMVIDTLFWDVEEMESNIIYMEFRNVKNVIIEEHARVLPNGFCDFNDFLTCIEIPSNVLRIEAMAFNHCSNLSNVVLNEGLEEIGYMAFNDCPLIEELNFPSSLQILHNEFENTSLVEISIPENVRELYHLKCNTLRRINYNARNATVNGSLLELLEDSVELFIGQEVAVLNNNCFGGKIRNRIDIPNSVKYIGEAVFVNKKIGSLPPILNYVGRSAFSCADFGDSLNLPKVGVVDNCAFSNSPALEKLVINEADSIKDGAFMTCPLLKYVEVTTAIPAYMGSIPFYNTPITNIIVPNCECIDAYEEKWASAKDTYVNPVSFVSKIPCDQEGVYDIEFEKRDDYKAQKIIQDGMMVISFPNGREYNLLGSQIKK